MSAYISYIWMTVHEDGRYRAELWLSPFGGQLIAMTRWVNKRSWATRDGRRIFQVFDEVE